VYTNLLQIESDERNFTYQITLESVPGINQYWTIRVRFLAQRNI